MDEDAKKLSKIFGFKITHLNEEVVKCGFPTQRLAYYVKLLEQLNVDFEIIDNDILVTSHENYIDNTLVKDIVNKILNLNMDEISCKQSFDLLYKIHKDLRQLEKGGNNGK